MKVAKGALKMDNVSFTDVKQIEEAFFEQFIKNIAIPDSKCWYLEYFPNADETAICLKRMNESPILQEYITGAFTAAFRFSIIKQTSVVDMNKNVDINKPLNDLAIMFEQETSQSFPNLKISDIEPISLKMISPPINIKDDKHETVQLSATYEFIYKKKGAFE